MLKRRVLKRRVLAVDVVATTDQPCSCGSLHIRIAPARDFEATAPIKS